MSVGSIALAEIDAACRYTLGLLEGFDDARWFHQPAEGVTHVAWQVGHICTSAYSLGLLRQRGEQPGDDALVPSRYLALFLRGLTPEPDATKNPSPAELRATFERVHARIAEEVAKCSDAELDEPPIGKPHPLFSTKAGSLFWCARHEMLHAGQIGLLKRLLGDAPRW